MKRIIFLFIVFGLLTAEAQAATRIDSSTMLLDSNIEQAQQDTGIPLGSVMAWNSMGMPKSGEWLECNGQTISIVEYPDFVKKFGPVLPDYRGVFIRAKGVNQFGGASAGLGQFQSGQIPDHTHKVMHKKAKQNFFEKGNFTTYKYSEEALASGGVNSPSTSATEENRPVNKAVKYIIKVK